MAGPYELDAAERRDFEEYLWEFYQSNEVSLTLLGEIRIEPLMADEAAPDEVLAKTTVFLACLDELYDHLDGNRYPVRDLDKYHRKCRELAKFILGGRMR